MSTSKPIPQQFTPQDGGLRLGDYEFMRLAILNFNSSTSTYGIAAAGTTQATATQLNSVYNQVDTATSGQGVNLPLSTGKHSVPCQNVTVVNNTVNSIVAYGAQGSTDTINGFAATTGVPIPGGAVVNFISVKGGAWFTSDVAGANRYGTFVLNGTASVTVTNTTVAISDTVAISLNTVGGTVGAIPHLATITAGTGFTVVGTAADTSTYNYTLIGAN